MQTTLKQYQYNNRSEKRSIMKHNCKVLSKVADCSTAVKKGADVTVSVDVTSIVEYIAIAGAAIVGIIFGTKAWLEYQKLQKEKEQ